jgi:hypothetical protein
VEGPDAEDEADECRALLEEARDVLLELIMIYN